jgi:membrane protein YqaA with SNARE-associated domain
MHRLVALVQHLAAWIPAAAQHLGGPGLTLVAFLDSSFLPLPEVPDLLLVLLTVAAPVKWLYFAAMTTAGSLLGCFVIYAIARRGGAGLIRRRFSPRLVERVMPLVTRHGLTAVIVACLLPPPAPFKLFVLLAGVADMRPRAFLLAIAIGRGFRFGVEGWLAYEYGDRATQYIRDNLPTLSLWLAGAVVVLALAGVARRWAVSRHPSA